MFDINSFIDNYTQNQVTRDFIRTAVNRPVNTLSQIERNSIYTMLKTGNVGNYLYSIISDVNNYNDGWSKEIWVDTEGNSRPAMGKLFHANSVKTAIDFIRRQELYSREFGAGLGIQTPQRSDADDQAMGIFNDIFFDNSDIPHYTRTNTSAYGPVMFVFNPEIIKDNASVLLTKTNPMLSTTLLFKDLYYFNVDDIRDNMDYSMHFLSTIRQHTTIHNVAELPFEDLLFAIYIEKQRGRTGRENDLKTLIRQELNNVGLNHVPVAIRPDEPTNAFRLDQYATSYSDLWGFP